MPRPERSWRTVSRAATTTEAHIVKGRAVIRATSGAYQRFAPSKETANFRERGEWTSDASAKSARRSPYFSMSSMILGRSVTVF
jgi:hypothetical protein